MIRLHDWILARPNVRGTLRLATIAAGLWLILTEGQWPGPEAWLIIAAACWAGHLYGPRYMYRWRPLRLIAFLGFFLRRSLLGGVDVARRALSPELPIEPRLVRKTLRVGVDQPRTLIVAAVSLLPGTLAVDVQGGELIVHLLAPGMEGEVDALEEQVQALFQSTELEETAAPGEPR